MPIETERPSNTPSASTGSFQFQVGDRTYFLRYDDRGNGYCIVCNGIIVDFASCVYYGETRALMKIAARMHKIAVEGA